MYTFRVAGSAGAGSELDSIAGRLCAGSRVELPDFAGAPRRIARITTITRARYR